MGGANNATVVTPDVTVCNSVVHVVDRVLLPNATLIYIPTYSNESTNTLSIEKISKNFYSANGWKYNVPFTWGQSVTRLYFTDLYSLLPETT